MHYLNQTTATRYSPVMPKLAIGAAPLVGVWSAEQTAAFCLTRDRANLAAAEAAFAAACAALGAANRIKGGMRRHWQAKAMRMLNMRRAALREARAALASSLAAAPAALAS